MAVCVKSSPLSESKSKAKYRARFRRCIMISKDASAHVIGDDQLAIQDGRLRMDLFHQCRSKVLIAGELVFLPGKEPALPLLDDRQGAKAIVLNFIDPVPVIEGLGLLN